MTDDIACPQCRRKLRVPEGYTSGELRCPQCQAVFRMEDTRSNPADAVQAGPPPLASKRPPRLVGAAEEEDEGELPYQLAVHRDFTPGGGLVLTVKVFLGLNLVLSLAGLGSDYLQYNLANRLVAGDNVPDAELDVNDLRQMLIGLLDLGILIATVVVFAMWFYRAHANLKALGSPYLQYTSGWAAGCWFVPILNLFRPVQIAQEIWRKSDPDFAISEGGREGSNSTLIGFWWTAWIISNVINNIAFRVTLAANTPDSLRGATMLNMIAELATLVAGTLALAVVSAIDSRQTARAAAMQGERRERDF